MKFEGYLTTFVGVVNTLVMNKKHEKVFLKVFEKLLKSGFVKFFLKIIAEKIRLFINRYSQHHAIYYKTCYCKRFPLFMYGIQKQPSYVAHLCHAGLYFKHWLPGKALNIQQNNF